MRKQKIIRIITAVSLSISLLAAGGIYASAQTPETASAVPKEFKDVAAATVNRGVDYDLSSLDLKTLPAYMEESLGFSELSAEKQPKSVTDLNVEDLYSFTTYNEDDTLTLYMFSEPVKFVDKETYAIRFIDNTIKVSAENSPPILSGQLNAVGNELYSAKSYTNTANFFKVDMPSSVNQGISLSYDNKKFTLSPATASLSTATLKTAAHRGMREQVVEYRNALGDGIHLQYVPINNGVKENIILDRYPGRNSFNFIFDAGGYYPVYTEGESIPFADPTTDEIALILGQADARDSYTGDETDGHFTLYNSLKVESLGNGKYTLTVTIDNDFLTDPDTVYPVVIDPTVSLPNNTVKDTTVYSAKPTSSAYYSSAYLIVGNHGTAYGEGIAFIQSNYNYNLQPLLTYENIVSARYHVYEGSGKTNSSTINVGFTTTTWDQTTLTYNGKPSYSKTSSKTISASGWYDFNITTQAKSWVRGHKTGYNYDPATGFILYANDPNASSKHFCSAEHSTKAPAISITYHEANMYHVNQTYGNQQFKAWGRLINGVSPVYSFTVTTAGTYRIETLNSTYFGANAEEFNTRLYLYDNHHNHITQATGNNGNSVTSGASVYEHIVINLSPGTYHVCVADNSTYMLDVRCYLIIEGFLPNGAAQGELCAPYDMYANRYAEFYKIGENSASYNCFDHALMETTDTDTNVCDINYGDREYVNNAILNFRSGYKSHSEATNNCIVAYGTPDNINHVAKITNGVVTAKLSWMELVMHPTYDVYLSDNCAQINFYVKK